MDYQQLILMRETGRMLFHLCEKNLAYHSKEKRFYIRLCSDDGTRERWVVAPARGRAQAINSLLSEKRSWIIANHSQKIYNLAIVYKKKFLWSIAAAAAIVR